ncbi:hypothetical protein RyT2_12240 [Pseudolactococcus yaeyamensis]
MVKLMIIAGHGAGHGAGDSGAVGNGYSEAERVRVLASKMKELGGGDVALGNITRNYYADDGISNLSLSGDTQIIELHLDSAGPTARGGHTIIKSGIGGSDSYDQAIANYLAQVFPGRAQTIVERDDLANPNRAYARGYSYRLVEVCFITNSEDMQKFNSHIDDIAKGLLGCFGIGVGSTAPSVSPSAPDLNGIARQVIAGHFGNGEDRKRNLEARGYHYAQVQAKVNELLGSGLVSSPAVDLNAVADAVIRGEYGNGDTRRQRLSAAGYDYNVVQALVNQKLG